MPGPLRILLAEDEPLNALTLKTQLEGMGHSVIGPAHDGREAVDLARENDLDLAILDVRMPRLSGVDAAREIFDLAPLPIILLTGYSDQTALAGAVRAPVSQYLIKPVTADDLAPVIQVARARFEERTRFAAEAATISRKLEDRKVIERAKGLLMQARGLSESEAYRLLQKESQNRNTSMAEIAATIVDADALLRDTH
jgi:two-component system, response regulator PdtaR